MDIVLKYFERIAGSIQTVSGGSELDYSTKPKTGSKNCLNLSIFRMNWAVWPCVTQGRFVRKRRQCFSNIRSRNKSWGFFLSFGRRVGKKYCFSWSFFFLLVSVQFSPSVLSDSSWPHESQHARSPCPSPTPGVHSDSCPSSQWCHPAISSSIVPFSSCPQSLTTSESSPVTQLFAWGGQSTGVSASALFPPKKSQGWSPSEWTGWISLQSKGLERVFSNTTVQKHQFFGAQPSSQSNSHIHTWPQEKP